MVAGRSFYLPGSLNKETEANLDQWNKVTPPLYLWSHNAFYDKHMQIAHTNGHFSVFDPQQVRQPDSRYIKDSSFVILASFLGAVGLRRQKENLPTLQLLN